MDDAHVQYYHDMLARDRAVLIIRKGHLVSIVTFFIGSNDERYLTSHVPWTIIDDEPSGNTVYIDQWLTYKGRETHSFVHREFTKLLRGMKQKFPNIKVAKWIRVCPQFRKNKITEGVKSHVHCKDIK